MQPIITVLQDETGTYHVQSGLGPVKVIQVMAAVLASLTRALMDVQTISEN